MSVFPKRAAVGEVVVVHANLLGSSLGGVAGHAEVSAKVIDPDGRGTELGRRTFLTAPWPKVDAPERGSIEDAGGVRKAVPIVLLASMMSRGADRSRVLDLLQNVQDGTHVYMPFAIQHGSALGRYQVCVEVRSEGRLITSSTSDDDHFFVDSLRAGCADDGIGWVENLGPEVVPARLVILDCERRLHSSRLVRVSPHTRSNLTLDKGRDGATALLFYAEDRCCVPLLPITHGDVPGQVVLRNPSVRTLTRGGETFLTHLDQDEIWQLDSVTARAWRAADGLTPIEDPDLEESLAKLVSLDLARNLTCPAAASEGTP